MTTSNRVARGPKIPNSTTLRRIPLILGLALMGSLLFHDVHEFFVTNEGIAYFASRPLRLLHAVLIGLIGGAVAVAISRLSPSSQRSLKLIALGCLGVFFIGALAFFSYTLL